MTALQDVPLHVDRLANGFEVLLRPVPGIDVAAVCLQYDVGFRTEPVDGVAHLVEHVMGQGSSSRRGQHSDHIAHLGGIANARTAPDHTQYLQVLPSAHLEEALRLEGERMGDPDLRPEVLAAHVAVVQAEIRRNVTHRPHGGLILFDLAAALFDLHANAHNGYGALESIATLGREEIASFLQTCYSPHRAHLAIVGGLDVRPTMQLIGEIFSASARREWEPPSLEERPIGAPRRAGREAVNVSSGRTAWAFRVPDPRDLRAFLPVVLLAELLESGYFPDACRPPAQPLSWRVDRTGNPFEVLGPTMFVADAVHAVSTDVEAVEDELRDLLRGVAANEGRSLDQALQGVVRRTAVHLLGELDSVTSHAAWLCTGSGMHDDPDFVSRLVDTLPEVAPAALRAAASVLAEAPAARVTSLPRDVAA